MKIKEFTGHLRKLRKSYNLGLLPTPLMIPNSTGPGWVEAHAIVCFHTSGACLQLDGLLYYHLNEGARFQTPDAARKLGLRRTDWHEIFLAANERRQHLLDLRTRLLDVCGLSEMDHENRIHYRRPPYCAVCTHKRPCPDHRDV